MRPSLWVVIEKITFLSRKIRQKIRIFSGRNFRQKFVIGFFIKIIELCKIMLVCVRLCKRLIFRQIRQTKNRLIWRVKLLILLVGLRTAYFLTFLYSFIT